jgi:hypothetical protein
MMKVRYLDKGSTEERAAHVVKALMSGGWVLRQNQEYTAHLLDLTDGEICVVPRDVMEFLIAHDVIEFEREQ